MMFLFKRNSLLIVLHVFACVSCINTNPADQVPSSKPVLSLNEVIEERFEIEDKIDGDLNGDEYTDAVYVIQLNESNERRVVVCFGQADQQFVVFYNSGKAILNKNEYNSGNDPFTELQIDRGIFRIVHQENGKKNCFMIHEFKFQPEDESIYLNQVTHNLCNRSRVGNNMTEMKSVDDFGKVNLFEFDIRKPY